MTAESLDVPEIRRSERHLPGEAGIWIIILGDMAVFGLFFVTFVFYRSQDLALYVQSQLTLSQASGVVNTVLLLTSSWFVASGIHAVRVSSGKAGSGFFALAFLCGAGFVAVKISEYTAKFSAGITINTNEFYIFYFMFTGIHLMHVLIGLGVLAYARRRARRQNLEPADIEVLESCGVFWHMVDILWIILFAIFYLMK